MKKSFTRPADPNSPYSSPSNSLEFTRRIDRNNAHEVPLGDLLAEYDSDPTNGLTSKKAAEKLLSEGPNKLKPAKPNYLKKIFEYFFGGFCWLLWLGSLLSFIAWKPLGQPPALFDLVLGITLVVVILLQAAFTAYQDWSSSRIMKSIGKMLPQFTIAVRDGKASQVTVASLVKGDIIQVTQGNKIPADVRYIEVNMLKVDRSIVTGESLPVTGTVEPTDSRLLDSCNVGLMGTLVVEGNATGVVFQTGDETLVGQVAKMANSGANKETILQMEIRKFTIVIASLAITTASICMIVWAAWLRVDYPGFLSLSNMLSNDMGIIVAFVPDGLPIAVTLVLTVIAARMKEQKILVKSLPIVETLGSVNVICSDKTGTLTTNQMVVAMNSAFSLEAPVQGIEPENPNPIMKNSISMLKSLAHLCNRATFDPADLDLPIPSRRARGDATDVALLRFAATRDIELEKKDYELLHYIPFSSKTKYMATIYKPLKLDTCPFVTDENFSIIMVKGAPEILFPYCTRFVNPSENREILDFTPERMAELEEIQNKWSSQGLRVLLLSFRELDNKELSDALLDHGAGLNGLIKKLIIVGLVGIMDPPREETAGVVETCRQAGVRVFMVTGDNAATAASIAKRVGIFRKDKIDSFSDIQSHPKPFEVEDNDQERPLFQRALHPRKSRYGDPQDRPLEEASVLLTGLDLQKFEPHHWDIIERYREIVFSRTTPDQKFKIVKELQKRGNIVAVTGDGVNDAPALKTAHIGVAMGNGSDAAIEAGAMVLLDSNFSSIVVALRQGRTVFENLKKVCLYLLPAGSFSELTPVLANIYLGVPLPLSPFLMIVICIMTDMGPAMVLMYESSEKDLLRRPPRKIGEDHLVDWKLMLHAYGFVGLLETIFAHFLFFLYMYREWGLRPKQLFLAFDKYGVDGYGGLTVEQQTTANNGGQCVYFVALVMMQLFGNMMATRTRHLSILQHPPTKNPRILAAIVASISIAVFFVYCGPIQSAVGTQDIPAEYWFIPIPFGIVILIADELRKFAVRRYHDSWIAKVAW